MSSSVFQNNKKKKKKNLRLYKLQSDWLGNKTKTMSKTPPQISKLLSINEAGSGRRKFADLFGARFGHKSATVCTKMAYRDVRETGQKKYIQGVQYDDSNLRFRHVRYYSGQ